MVKKRDRKKEMTPEQIAKYAQTATERVAYLLKDFLNKTGKIVASIDIITQGEPDGTGFNITQTVNLRYGIPDPIVTEGPVSEFKGIIL